jgi:integrase
MTGTRRHFGNVRTLPSGRYQASYWFEGRRHIASRTFGTKTDAHLFLDDISTTLTRGDWVDPDAGRRNFAQYAQEWLTQRTELRPLSRDQYSSLIANHLNPAFGHMELARVSAGQVRSWHAQTVARRPGAAANAYRLLRAIFNTAVTDELVTRNPCRVKGAGADRAKERAIPTVGQVEVLMNAMPAQLRAAVVLAAWGILRRGEVLGLRRGDIDLEAGTVRVERSLGERRNGDLMIGPPKSAAGVRTVNMPVSALRVIEDHLEDFVGPGAHASLFVGRTGQPLRPRGIEDAWRAAREEIGLPEMRFHDLRHFAGTMAAAAGASTKEVMARGGWSSPQMALRYEHATQHRDRSIAEALEVMARVGVPPAKVLESASETPQDSIHSRTQRARQVVGDGAEISEIAPVQGISAAKVRPSGFEPETCGVRFRCSQAFAGVRNCALTLDLPFARVRTGSQASALRGSPFGSPKSSKVDFLELWKAPKCARIAGLRESIQSLVGSKSSAIRDRKCASVTRPIWAPRSTQRPAGWCSAESRNAHPNSAQAWGRVRSKPIKQHWN